MVPLLIRISIIHHFFFAFMFFINVICALKYIYTRRMEGIIHGRNVRSVYWLHSKSKCQYNMPVFIQDLVFSKLSKKNASCYRLLWLHLSLSAQTIRVCKSYLANIGRCFSIEKLISV